MPFGLPNRVYRASPLTLGDWSPRLLVMSQLALQIVFNSIHVSEKHDNEHIRTENSPSMRRGSTVNSRRLSRVHEGSTNLGIKRRNPPQAKPEARKTPEPL